MTATKTSKAVHAYVTDECDDGYKEFAAAEGVSKTAIVEIVGHHLDILITPNMIDDMRALDAERRVRSHLR